MLVTFSHCENEASLDAPRTVLPLLFGPRLPASLLDVGCGIGAWMQVSIDLGVKEVFGIDGVPLTPDQLMVPPRCFGVQDLTIRWDLGRTFEICLCLEVAEHLDQKYAPLLVRNLTTHSATIMFSAACPSQYGQHHVNCQWPNYWQGLFNAVGFVCDDSLRWKIWDISQVEPWYRQNIFVAHWAPKTAGQEPRIHGVIHPEMLSRRAFDILRKDREEQFASIEAGFQPPLWYLTTAARAFFAKLARRLGRRSVRKSDGR
jgi:hypothetical protein